MTLRQNDILIKCYGGGVFFWWQLGALSQILNNIKKNKNIKIDNIKFICISSGILTGVFTICKIDSIQISNQIEMLIRKYKKNNNLSDIYFYLNNLLDNILPKNAHELCTNRLYIVSLHLFKGIDTKYIFETRQELISDILSGLNLPVWGGFFNLLKKSYKIDYIINSIDISNNYSKCNNQISLYYKNDKKNKEFSPFVFYKKEKYLELYKNGEEYGNKIIVFKTFNNIELDDTQNKEVYVKNPYQKELKIFILSSISTLFFHKLFPVNIAKGIIPSLIGIYSLPIIYNNNLNVNIFENSNSEKYLSLITSYLGHILIDIYFIRKDYGLVIHHLITFIGAFFSLLIRNLRNISISMIGSEILTLVTILTNLSLVNKNRNIKKILNFVKILIIVIYRIPLMKNTILQSLEKKNKGIYKFILPATIPILGLDIWWLKIYLNKVLNK